MEQRKYLLSTRHHICTLHSSLPVLRTTLQSRPIPISTIRKLKLGKGKAVGPHPAISKDLGTLESKFRIV